MGVSHIYDSDYSPRPAQYGKMFLPIAKIGYDKEYTNSDEYQLRMQVVLDTAERIISEHREKDLSTD